MRSFLFGLSVLSLSLVLALALLALPANAQCPPGNVSVEAQHQALSRRAMAAAERGQLAEALRFSREMLILCPTDHRARYAAAYAAFRLGLEVQASRDSLECMRSTDPVIAEACWMLLWRIVVASHQEYQRAEADAGVVCMAPARDGTCPPR